MNKRVIAFLSIFSLSLCLPLIAANAAVKAGASCKTLGLTSIVSGKTFTCTKSGKKLIWDKGVSIGSKAISDNYQSKQLVLDECKLLETKNTQDNSSGKGFPIRGALPSIGEINIAIIPIDFNNAPGVGVPGEMFKDDLLKIREWSEFYSKGNLKYFPKLVSNSWLRAPKGADWYTRIGEKGAKSELQSQQIALQELITTADKVFDFTNTDFVYFAFPELAEKNFGTSVYTGAAKGQRVAISTNEGNINISAYGEMGGAYLSYDRSQIWEHLIHELLHFQGIIGHGPLNGSSLGIMQNQWGSSQSLSAWESFMAGWFGAKDIICLDKKSISSTLYISLGSIDKMDSSPIAILIKLSEEEAIVVEKRSDGKFTNFSKSTNFVYFPEIDDFKGKSTFTAYYLNVNSPVYRDDSDPSSEFRNFWFYLRENGKIAITNSITEKGVRFKIRSTNQIEISSVA